VDITTLRLLLGGRKEKKEVLRNLKKK